MPTRERRVDRGRRQARRALALIGDELREARLTAGLSQRSVADAAGTSISAVSRIERGVAIHAPYERIAVVASILGLDVPLRAFPAGDPVRDQAQLALLARFRTALHSGLTWRTEVPIRRDGDRRAWDAVIGGSGWRLPIDAESRLRDVQALTRREALKRRDDGSSVTVLLVAATRHNRHVLRLAGPDLVADFPIGSREALATLVKGQPLPASAIIVI